MSFSHQFKLLVFPWCQTDSKFPPVPKTLVNILANNNRAAVLILPLISSSSSFWSKVFSPFHRTNSNWFYYHSQVPSIYDFFSHQRWLMVFLKSLRTLFSIQTDFNSAVVWMVSIHSLVGWLVGWVLSHINLCRLFNTKSILYHFYFKQFSLAWVHSLIVKNISISSYSV